jgi:transcriptional regulator with XRE-family HTH domain
MSVFSERLKWLRERKGLTQKEMAEKLDISRSNYSKYEYGQREPTIETLRKFPDILGESLDFLVGVIDYDSETETVMDELRMAGSNSLTMYQKYKALKEIVDSSDNPDKGSLEVLVYQVKLSKDGLIRFIEISKSLVEKIREKVDGIPCISEENKIHMNNISRRVLFEEMSENEELVKSLMNND